ncbi:MAG TPA: SUMF1/EgtB/PvdO family nonheme iron enzyme, partial [Candidatus Dormibacteraeota bacterium]|nr:SUMF1/EgtB/PvdO family nonheme iron enzyme [Candidatus Dormibacteraeota bacterium]
MPVFNEYETVGEPIAVIEERGHVSTVWQARQTGAKTERLFAVKCYHPRQRHAKGEREESLDSDRCLQFIEAVKRLKKAHSEGGKCLAPIYAFGILPEGAWYVTDYYQGRTLKELITRRGRVDGAALRHVVNAVAVACRALQQSGECSHGNLKPANVFLVGKARALRDRPLHLIDAYPASAVQLAGLDESDSKQLLETLVPAMEAQDLRAIGELILQLVEGRMVSSSYDYNYPIERSKAWEHLGKDGEYWRELCNKLLNPQLSLETVNLEWLERECAPSGAGGKVLLVAAVLVGLAVIGGGMYFVVLLGHNKQTAEFKRHQQAAEAAWGSTNLLAAQKEINAALAIDPRDQHLVDAAKELKSRIDDQMESYTRALTDSQNQFGIGETDKAGTSLAKALRLFPEGALAREEQDYQKAINAAQKAYIASNWPAVLENANVAVAKKKDDPKARNLAQEAENRMAAAKTEKESRQAMEKASSDAETLMTKDEYGAAQVQYAVAAKLGAQLKDARAPGWEAKQGLADLLSRADNERKKSEGHESEEIRLLELANTNKTAPKKLAEWRLDADRRLALFLSKSTSLADIGKRLQEGEDLLGKEDYAGAEKSFGLAAQLADKFKDGRSGQAAQKRSYAGFLKDAAVAKKKGDVFVNDEIKGLEGANGILQVKRISDWLAEARKRYASQRTNEQKKTDLATARSEATASFNAEKYGPAESSFQRAYELANELGDPAKAELDRQRMSAGLLKKAQDAKTAGEGHEAEELGFLDQARATKVQPKNLDAWITEAKARQERFGAKSTALAELNKAALEADALLKQGKYLEALQGYRRAASLAETNEPVRAGAIKQDIAYAGFLESAGKAKNAGEGHQNEEVVALEAAGRIKTNDWAIAWLSEARGRLELAKKSGEQKEKLAQTVLQAEKSFDEQDYKTAASKYGDAGLIAKQVRDKREAELQAKQKGAVLLADAWAARTAGSSKIEAELTALSEAQNTVATAVSDVRFSKRINTWLDEAKKRKQLNQTRGEFDRALADAASAITNNQFAVAKEKFDAALQFAQEVGETNKVAEIRTQSKMAELLSAAGLAANSNPEAAFQSAASAVDLSTRTASPGLRQFGDIPAKVAFQIATNACSQAVVDIGSTSVTNWLDRVKSFPGGPAIAADFAARIPRDRERKFGGFTFRLVKAAKPAIYASAVEVTQKQLHELVPTVNGTAENQPARCTWQDATNFCARLQAKWDAECSNKALIRLPTVDEYLAMTQLRADDDFTNILDHGRHQWVVGTNVQARLQKSGEYVAEGFKVEVPRAVSQGRTNGLGLVDIIGNAQEWSQEQA